MSLAINIAWGKRDAHGWTCPCGERCSILAAPDTQPYESHYKGKKHQAGIAPAAKGHQTSMMRFFSQSSQGSQPSQHESSIASQPSNDPSSPRSLTSVEPVVELLVSCPVPTKCMGVLPLGVSSALVLRGCYPLMCHAHEKVHWFYVDRVGCFSCDPLCTREARVDETGNPLPCIPCEALPQDNTLCKWMREESTTDSGTVHWNLGFLKLVEHAAGHRAEKRAAVRELRRVSDACHTLVQKCDAHKALILAIGQDKRPLASRKAARLMCIPVNGTFE